MDGRLATTTATAAASPDRTGDDLLTGDWLAAGPGVWGQSPQTELVMFLATFWPAMFESWQCFGRQRFGSGGVLGGGVSVVAVF